MLKTKILFQWNPNNSGEIIEAFKYQTAKVNRNGIIFFIQIVSSKPVDILNEQQNLNNN
jgi:hypothetical protein